ncbi:OmpA family protein [candidate division KSB1 bacterium]|nr:OmpA family protein [candidate division KSB1 bacterium]
MSMHRCFGIWFIFFVMNYSPVRSNDISGRLGAGVFCSGIKMVGGNIERSSFDQWAGIRLKYGFSSTFAGDINFGFGWVYSSNLLDIKKFEPCGGFKTFLVPFNANLVVNVLPFNRYRPYFSFGAGFTQWDIRKLPKEGLATFTVGESIFGSQINASLICGLGCELFVMEDIAFDLIFKYHLLLKDNNEPIKLGAEANDCILETGISISFFTGGFKDTDHDGIEDKFDLDIETPEDFDGFEDRDGKPDLDNDQDGVPDKLDKAPNSAEDIDNFQDDDGKPDPDNDGDSILDQFDRCPHFPEDIDGYEDEDGCPDFDNDGDTIPDSLDQCPNWPEDFNGYLDEDGCPDEKPAFAEVKRGEKVVLKGVNFTTNSARLTDSSFVILNEVVKTLKAYPDIMIEICGYTDSIGDWKHNLLLSEQRAESVKKYLVSQGIDESRIKTQGFGEQNPVASNKTKAGRAANRRIEFVRLK